MAPDRDDGKDKSPTETDNPFIKFRQFADSQISSLLQGIVGLPSAFSKNSNNARWGEFDENMRQRDELQKRQNDLRDLDIEKQNESKNSRSMDAGVDEMDERVARDIPLYSPVSRSLFNHLHVAKNDSDTKDDWKPVDGRWGITGSFYHPLGACRSRIDPLKAFRYSIYHDLQNSPLLRSDYSLLPYLLFSPYSPLKLENEVESAQSKRYSHPSVTLPHNAWDQLPYCEAFEDLILVTQGRQMRGTTTTVALPMVEPERSWIYNLWAHGILQQSDTTKDPSIAHFRNLLTQIAREDGWEQKYLDSRPEDAQTEQEMYERFLCRASKIASLPEGLEDVVRSFFSGSEAWINTTFLDPVEMKHRLKGFAEFLKRETGDEREDGRRGNAARLLESQFAEVLEQLENLRIPDSRSRTVESFSETKIGKELEEFKRKAGADPEKVVSSSTSTERTRNEDGTVETRVEIWRRYADGRETVTTTSHTEGPRILNNDDHDPSAPGERDQLIVRQKADNKKEKRKAGWFWN